MNVLSVFTALLGAKAAPAAGELLILDSKGVAVAPGASGPYTEGEVLSLLVGLPSGKTRHLGNINPKNFSFKYVKYAAAAGKAIRIGYDGAANNIVVSDPAAASNVGKHGTLSITVKNFDKATENSSGDLTSGIVQIVAGDTTATVLAKLVALATELVATVNSKYGAGSITLTSSIANTAQAYINLACAAGLNAFVSIDGIFDGTVIKVTTTAPLKSAMTGVAVLAREKEQAVQAGYNRTQTDMAPMFNLDAFRLASAASNYDGMVIETAMAEPYGHTKKSITVEIELCAPTGAGVLGAAMTDLVAVLQEVYNNNIGLSQAAADGLYVGV